MMDNVTLGQIRDIVLWIVAFSGGLATIIKVIKSTISKAFVPIEKKIDIVDLNATKNYLVARLAELKDGTGLDDISRERFFEQYEHYKKLGGNSYITHEVEILQREGKL